MNIGAARAAGGRRCWAFCSAPSRALRNRSAAWRRRRRVRRFSSRRAPGRRCWCPAAWPAWPGAEVAGPDRPAHALHVPAGYGFAAIIVAFVGRLHPVGMVFSAILMSMFYIGGELAQSRLACPSRSPACSRACCCSRCWPATRFIHYRACAGWPEEPRWNPYDHCCLGRHLQRRHRSGHRRAGPADQRKAGIVNLGAEGMMLCAALAGSPPWSTPATTGWASPPAWRRRGWPPSSAAGDLAQHQPVRHRLALSLFGVGLSAFAGIPTCRRSCCLSGRSRRSGAGDMPPGSGRRCSASTRWSTGRSR